MQALETGLTDSTETLPHLCKLLGICAALLKPLLFGTLVTALESGDLRKA